MSVTMGVANNRQEDAIAPLGISISAGSPDPAGGAYSFTPDPLVGFKGAYF